MDYFQICDWVHLVASISDLENLLEKQLLSDPTNREVIRAFAAENSWKMRVQKISELLLESTAKKAI